MGPPLFCKEAARGVRLGNVHRTIDYGRKT